VGKGLNIYTNLKISMSL